jgi:hypothetical protein
LARWPDSAIGVNGARESGSRAECGSRGQAGTRRREQADVDGRSHGHVGSRARVYRRRRVCNGQLGIRVGSGNAGEGPGRHVAMLHAAMLQLATTGTDL